MSMTQMHDSDPFSSKSLLQGVSQNLPIDHDDLQNIKFHFNQTIDEICIEHKEHKYKEKDQNLLIPSWKKSIGKQSKGIQKKSIFRKIKNKMDRIRKVNPKVKEFMKKISEQIKTQVLHPTMEIQQDQIQKEEQKKFAAQEVFNIQQKHEETVRKPLNDEEFLNYSCYRSVLKQRKMDDDVESDDEVLHAGMCFMYGELLYSVGKQMQNTNKKETHKKENTYSRKKNFQNKENINQNIIVQNCSLKKKNQKAAKTGPSLQPKRLFN